LNIENVNISEFLENISTNFKQISNSQNVKVVVNSESKNIKIKTDRTLLGRVVENLIKNAVEASNTGQEIRVGIRYENNQLIIDVHNESVIPLEIQSKIFQRSFSTKGGGRGIGTYSIKYLTENYLNGMVSFISNKENGTSFIVKIPAELEN